MNRFWKSTPEGIWQGRDDSKESPIAKRLFQTIETAETFSPEKYGGKTAMIGFECDEGVRINKGRTGASKAPNEIRKSMANLASFSELYNIVDMGNIGFIKPPLASAQNALSVAVEKCLKAGMKTLVLGGGHETAYGHGMGIFNAFPDSKIGIINFDAHLDIRTAAEGSSGTPFKQLADYCKQSGRPFQYMCVGASKAANTAALLKTAEELDIKIIWDLDCIENHRYVGEQIVDFIKNVDLVYLTIDLDVLPFSSMYAVSAPAALGVELRTLINIYELIAASKKLKAVDLVEYVPGFDPDKLCVRAIGRLVWQICNDWKNG